MQGVELIKVDIQLGFTIECLKCFDTIKIIFSHIRTNVSENDFI
jgi:hypothetical protein